MIFFHKMLKNACMLEELEIPHVSVEEIGILVISFIWATTWVDGYEHMAKNSFQNYMTRTFQMIMFDHYEEDANGGGVLLRQGVARWCVY